MAKFDLRLTSNFLKQRTRQTLTTILQIGTRPGTINGWSHPLLLRTTRNWRTTPGETVIIVTPIEIQSVVLQQHIVKLFQMGGRFKFAHGKVQRLVGLVAAQHHVTGRLLQQHGHFLRFPISSLAEIDGVVIVFGF